MDQINNIMVKYKYPELRVRDGIAEEISKIEQEIQWHFPEDYKYYVLNFTEHEIELNHQFIITWDIFELLEVNRKNFYAEQEVFAIGGDGGGSFIGFDLSEKENGRIIYDNMIGCERQYFVEIGSSFTDIFMRLEKGITWNV
mgnify:CR=1 FL=1